LYANAAADPSGFGEGQIYLGSVRATTNANGNASFSFSRAGNFVGSVFTATATNLTTGDTSEFSRAVAATADDASPRIVVSEPAQGAFYNNFNAFTRLETISGTAQDANGIAAVTVRLIRLDAQGNPTYWAGDNTFTTSYNPAVNEHRAEGTTNWSLALPLLPAGEYQLRARAVDRVGNVGLSETVSFTITGSPTPPPES
jgi:hypothetical protein